MSVVQYRFAYGGKSASVGMQRPPGTLALEKLGPTISGLFEAAFAKETTVLSISGFAGSYRAWDRSFLSLQDGCRPLMVDTLGFGQSRSSQ